MEEKISQATGKDKMFSLHASCISLPEPQLTGNEFAWLLQWPLLPRQQQLLCSLQGSLMQWIPGLRSLTLLPLAVWHGLSWQGQ